MNIFGKNFFTIAAVGLLGAGFGLIPTSSGIPIGASAAEAQTYHYRPTRNYRYRSAPAYRMPRQTNPVRRGIRRLSQMNGNAERRARWRARHPR